MCCRLNPGGAVLAEGNTVEKICECRVNPSRKGACWPLGQFQGTGSPLAKWVCRSIIYTQLDSLPTAADSEAWWSFQRCVPAHCRLLLASLRG